MGHPGSGRDGGSPPSGLTRRTFFRQGVGAAAAAAVAGATAERILADPYAPLGTTPGRLRSPVRVVGRVRTGGRGVARVAISDGLQVVETDADGRFEMNTTADRDFVWMSVPAGHRIPTHATGTASFYRPLITAGGEMDVLFDLERLPGSDERHALILLGDIQTETVDDMALFHERSVPDIRATVEALGDVETFGIACGDIMWDDLDLYPEYERGVSRIGVPFWQVIGNHDLNMENPTDETSTVTYSGRFGPRYYSFDRGQVHYVVLDDVFWHGSGYIGYLGADALTWLERDLARLEPGSTVMVATHIPATGSQFLRLGDRSPSVGTAITNREALYRLLEPFEAHILTGHTHECEHVFVRGTHEHVTGAVCGAWWTGPICFDGTPNGYCVYEVDGSGVRWRYKATGEAQDHQMRLYPPGSDPISRTDLVANVWNWDPDWTVRWFADGEPMGPMANRIGFDPLSVSLHFGGDLPLGRTWVEPMPTSHLFYAPIGEGVAVVTVEATDRFGMTFAERLRL